MQRDNVVHGMCVSLAICIQRYTHSTFQTSYPTFHVCLFLVDMSRLRFVLTRPPVLSNRPYTQTVSWSYCPTPHGPACLLCFLCMVCQHSTLAHNRPPLPTPYPLLPYSPCSCFWVCFCVALLTFSSRPVIIPQLGRRHLRGDRGGSVRLPQDRPPPRRDRRCEGRGQGPRRILLPRAAQGDRPVVCAGFRVRPGRRNVSLPVRRFACCILFCTL